MNNGNFSAKIHKDREEIVRFCEKNSKTYVYGAGTVAIFMCRYLLEEGIEITGFIVSDGKKQSDLFSNLPLYEISEVKIDKKDGIVLGVAPVLQGEIVETLLSSGVCKKQIYCQMIYWPNAYSAIMYDGLINRKLEDESVENGYFCYETELNRLGRKRHTDKSDEFHNYLNKYEFFLKKWKKECFTLLELGVLDGGSLMTWEDYFENAEIYGVDINSKCKKYEGGRRKVLIMDLSEEENLRELCKLSPLVVIDDASHMWSHQLKSLNYLFDSIQPGGVFIMEDLETSFPAYRNYFFGDSCVNTYEVCAEIAKMVCGREIMRKETSSAALWDIRKEIEHISRKIEMISFIHGSCIMVKK